MLPEGLETFFFKYRFLLFVLLGGVVFIGVGVFINNANVSGTKVEVLEALLVSAGGVSSSADRIWMEKTLNRAAKLTDGQKIYIPKAGEQSTVVSAKNTSEYQTVSPDFSGQKEGLVNINTASLKDLDSLPGIGPVYGQNIIEHRPYSNVGELLSKAVLKPSVYEKIKDLVTAY